jgi:hypothetical protein
MKPAKPAKSAPLSDAPSTARTESGVSAGLAAGSGAGSSRGAEWLLRAGLAALLIAVVIGSWSRYSRSVRSEFIGTNAARLAERDGFEVIALDQLRAALRLAPANPQNLTRKAVLRIQMENQKARAGSVRSMSQGLLDEALDDLEGTRFSTVMPSNVERKLAEVTAMMSGIAAATGEEERSKEYAAKTAAHSLAFLDLQGRPHQDAELFYTSAIRRAYQADRHDLVLKFHDHLRIHYPAIASGITADRQLVNRSRLMMGEGPLMVADVTQQLMQRPRDARLLGDAILAGSRYGQAARVVPVLEMVDRRATLAPEVRDFLHHLRAMAAQPSAP